MLAAGQGPSLPELEGMLRRLTAQRDTAQVVAAEARATLSLREAELQQLQQQLRHQDGAEPSGHFSWPTNLSSDSLLVQQQHAPATAPDAAALREALAAERQQARQLQAALHALTADMQRMQQDHQQQQQQQQLAVVPAGQGPGGSTTALVDVTNTEQQQQQQQQQQQKQKKQQQQQQGHDVQRLAKQLARAQARLKQLTSENERLMEMSNSLRAERNRLAKAQQCSSSGGQAPCSHSSTQPALPAQGFTLPPGLWPLLALPAAVANPAQLLASGRALEGAPPSSRSGSSNSNSPQHSVQQQLEVAAQQPPQQPQQQQQGLQGAAVVAAESTGGAAAPGMQQTIAIVGTQLREATRAAPGPGASTTAARGAAGRQLEQAQQQREPQGGRGKAPSPLRVRNYNLRSP